MVSVAIAEGVSEGQEVDQMKPCVHAGSNHLVSGTTARGSTGAVLCLMLCLAFATHMFVLARFCCTLPCVPASANRCVGIDCVLGMFVRVLTQLVPLWADEMVGNEVTEAAETCKEEMVGLGLAHSDGPIEVEYSGML